MDGKRLFDLAVVAAMAVVALPLGAAIGAAVALFGGKGPVLYRATRVGRDGRPFTLYKFRTMRVDQDGPAVTGGDDPRVTPIGRVLRASKLDELPQLLNVLLGDMSLVGPRPEDPRYVALYSTEQRDVLRVRPGLTSPAAVAYRHEEQLLRGDAVEVEERYVRQLLPAKLSMDLDYVRSPSLLQDVRILMATVRAVVGKG